MKFLLTVTPRRVQQMPSAALIDQNIAWIDARLKDKTADCTYGFVTGGGIAIINADSHEAVTKLLTSYPGYPFVEMKVEALCDIHAALEQVKIMAQRAAAV